MSSEKDKSICCIATTPLPGDNQFNGFHQPAGLTCSLREVTNWRATATSIKENFPTGRLRYRQLLGEVIETRDVIYAVLVHHANQLGIYHLQEKRKKHIWIMSSLSLASSWSRPPPLVVLRRCKSHGQFNDDPKYQLGCTVDTNLGTEKKPNSALG